MIRELTISDYALYSNLRSLGLSTDPTSFWASNEDELPNRESRFKDTVLSSDDCILGHFSDGELVGIGGFHRESRLKLRHKGFIWGVYTHPYHRGKGIGKLLMLAIMERASSIEGLTQINLSTRTDNLAALKLYEQLGFERYGVEKNSSLINGTFYHEVYLVKNVI